MKKTFLGLAFFALLFSCSCSSDFKVGADYKEITTVYCLLSQSDTANYVKINKGFFSESENNLIIAQNVDSIYYNNLEVKLEELSNGNVVNTYLLQKVNLVDEGYVKPNGTFQSNPNYAYKHKKKLDATRLHRLVVKNLTSGAEMDGFTSIINTNGFQLTQPFQGVPKGKINFDKPTDPTNFTWSSPTGATFYDLYIRFWYQEKNLTTNVTTHQYVDLPILRNVVSSEVSVTIPVQGTEFYAALSGELKAAANDIVRYIDTPDIIIQAGGAELKTYIEVTSAQGGITFDQIKPNYTNLRLGGVVGKDVLGILSTRGTSYAYEVPFTNKTLDSIKSGTFTKNLNFIGISSE